VNLTLARTWLQYGVRDLWYVHACITCNKVEAFHLVASLHIIYLKHSCNRITR
jgi:hypothetical protein